MPDGYTPPEQVEPRKSGDRPVASTKRNVLCGHLEEVVVGSFGADIVV
jgi:hypothetical protein